jgi:adenosyl cobinamide kinase/adenosyl cobinamide phosphate guanylyltransferase
MALTLLVGAARSGKSQIAARMASAWAGPVAVIATGEPRDEEMAARIARHREVRPAEWRTVEEPIEVAAAIAASASEEFVIVDCVTLWVSNLLERGVEPGDVEARAEEAGKVAAAHAAPVVVVSNEVGAGIVPMHPETRAYRDLMGSVNAILARAAERTLLTVAGRVLRLDDPEGVIGDASRG